MSTVWVSMPEDDVITHEVVEGTASIRFTKDPSPTATHTGVTPKGVVNVKV
jgi:hypothetical protein